MCCRGEQYDQADDRQDDGPAGRSLTVGDLFHSEETAQGEARPGEHADDRPIARLAPDAAEVAVLLGEGHAGDGQEDRQADPAADVVQRLGLSAEADRHDEAARGHPQRCANEQAGLSAPQSRELRKHR